MTTSGSVDFSVSRDDIIQDALELLGVIEPGATPDAALVTSLARTLNMMIKAWQVDGLAVFSIKQSYLFTDRDQTEYTLSTSGDHYTYSYTKQTIDGAVTAGAATFDLTDATDFVDGDNIGIYQSDNTMHWTTGTKSGNTITPAVVTTADVSDNATVYFYTDKADPPEKILEANLLNDSLNSRPLALFSRKEFAELSNKTYDGNITQVYFDDRVPDAHLFVWPQSSDPRDLVLFWVKRLREDFDAAADTPDFPQRWYFPLSYGLAVAAGPKLGVPGTNANFKEIKDQALFWYETAQNYDSQPEANIQFQVDMEHD
jgi:hypothetical protein